MMLMHIHQQKGNIRLKKKTNLGYRITCGIAHLLHKNVYVSTFTHRERNLQNVNTSEHLSFRWVLLSSLVYPKDISLIEEREKPFSLGRKTMHWAMNISLQKRKSVLQEEITQIAHYVLILYLSQQINVKSWKGISRALDFS